MATANEKDTIQNIRTLLFTHTSAVTAGEIIAANGQVLVAVSAADANVEAVYEYQGKIEFPKEAGLAMNPGDVAFWDDANSVMTRTAAGNTKAGPCVEGALAGDSVVTILLGPNRTKISQVAVTVAAAASAGSSAADASLVGAEVIGIVPTGNQDQLVDNVVVNADGSITVTLAAAATADNTLSVSVLSA